jgi:uncharacterized lipoprotein YmbA
MNVAYLLLAVLLSGCASQTIEPSYYLLRSNEDLQSRELNPSKNFSMGNVVIASYIDQQGLLMETADGEVRTAQHNLWAEPVYEGVRNFLMVEIAQAKGEDLLPSRLSNSTTVIDIRIDQLHGTRDGEAQLVAYWWLRRNGEVLSFYQFAETQALHAEGYAALVAAEEVLLTQLAKKIAASLVMPDS